MYGMHSNKGLSSHCWCCCMHLYVCIRGCDSTLYVGLTGIVRMLIQKPGNGSVKVLISMG